MATILSRFILPLLLLSVSFSSSCTAKPVSFREDFENGKKDAYADGVVALSSGKWILQNALIAGTDKDKKNGAGCLRIKSTGVATMDFDVSGDIKQILITHATYGTDAAAEWILQYSQDRGTKWQESGKSIYSTGIKNIAVFDVNLSGPIRFRIQHRNGGRLNIDDIGTAHGNVVNRNPPVKAARGENMALGNPSKADKRNPENYLLVKPQYTLSYNNKRGIANWVSWHISSAWKGDARRCNCFAPDNDLPTGYFKALTSQYIGKGFDRGHFCPSDDRDGNAEDNSATFRMTNIAPQAPNLNRDVWEKLESYCRQLSSEGNELYIIAGAYGLGGTGEKGARETLTTNITVPARFWKVIVVLPTGEKDLERINTATRIIAVDMPNIQSVNTYQWHHYRTSVDAIEKATGYDLLSNVPASLQKSLESNIDQGKTR